MTVSQITKESVLQALKQVQDPDFHKDIVTLGFVKEVTVREGKVTVVIELTTPACPFRNQMKDQAHEAVAALPGVKEVEVTMTSNVRSGELTQQEPEMLPEVKNIIAVASGKGGVGKSTVSANLALALAQTGAKVGLLDADIYGPTIPTLMGIKNPQVRQSEDHFLVPLEQYGVKIMSMGFFLPPDKAAVLRGPMLDKLLTQFLGDVAWGELDYLVIDLPPGTGDVQLSICQKIMMTGALVVSTPQDVALSVAQRAIFMFRQLNTPILGLVENMSYYLCSHCGQREEIFGTGAVKRASQDLNLPFLGEIPLATNIRACSDAGKPVVFSDPDSPQAKAFVQVAQNLAAQISIHNMTNAARPS